MNIASQGRFWAPHPIDFFKVAVGNAKLWMELKISNNHVEKDKVEDKAEGPAKKKAVFS